MSSQLNQTIRLDDGRTLGYAEYGDPGGKLVFFLHGQPGNRLFHPDPDITLKAGLRLVIPDRPGYGLSTYHPERTLLYWPGDLVQLANYLETDKFGLVGFSAGGPYALACGLRIPDKLTRLMLIGSAPPTSEPNLRKLLPALVRLNYWMLRLAPRLFYLSFRWYWKQARKNPHQFIQMATAQSSPADQSMLSRRESYSMLLKCWEENIRIESTGYVKDAQILLSDWGFDLAAVQTKVLLWWAEQDQNSPLIVQDYFAQNLPNTRQIRQPDVGHFGFLQNWDTICIILQS